MSGTGGGSTYTVDFEGNTRGIDAAIESMERRVAKVAQKFNDVFDRVNARNPDASLADKQRQAKDVTGNLGSVDPVAYRQWRKQQDRQDREYEKQAKTLDRQYDREWRQKLADRDRATKAEKKTADRAANADSRAEDKMNAWRQAHVNKSILEEGKGKRGLLGELFGGGGRQSGMSGILSRGATSLMGERGAGIAGGAARVIGGAAMGVIGGPAGAIASTLLGPLGILGGVIASVTGMIMKAGYQQVEKTRSMLGEMRTEQLVGRGGSRGMWQMQAMEGVRWGMNREETSAMRGAAWQAAGADVFSKYDTGIATGSLARMKMQGIEPGMAGKYAGLAKRFGISTGGIRGAERMSTIGYAMGLRGGEFGDTVTSGYEALGARGLGVDTAGFESFLGRSMGNDRFAAGGIQSVKGLMALEGMRGGVRDSVTAPFKELGQNLAFVRAAQLARKSGRTGAGFLSEMASIAETSPEMGAEGMRNMMAGFGPDMGGLMAGGAGGMSQATARALMGTIPGQEIGMPGGMLPSPFSRDSKEMLDAFNSSSGNDIRRMGSADDIKNLVQLQESMKDMSAELAKAAGSLASAANSFMGK